MKAWFHVHDLSDHQLKSDVVASLAEAGVSVHGLKLDAPSGPGILFFKQVTGRLCELLCEVSCNGLERVLAVALSRSVLTEGSAWRLLRAGASDVFAWDHSTDPAAEIAARLERWETVDRLLASPMVQNGLVGKSPAWTSKLREIIEVASFTNSSVLLMGESGTGKELVARLIHSLDQRPNKRSLVVLDCTTVVPELSGSEFFGHERGAFTGAVAAREGAFALADGGTLFLDEVGELPLTLQAELLRVVQEGTYKRVGSNTWQHTKFRLVCATNRDLQQAVSDGQFRRDLYYRIATCVCKLPPLSQRTEDILPLVQHFLQEMRPGKEPLELDESVCRYLLTREYPGNVRDLKQLVTRISHRHVGPGPITVGDIPPEERPSADLEPTEWRDEAFEQTVHRAVSLGVGLKEIGRAAEETAIRIAVSDEAGNLQRAAHKLRVTDRALQLRRASRRQREEQNTGEERSQ